MASNVTCWQQCIDFFVHCFVCFSNFCGDLNAPMSTKNFGLGIRRFAAKYFTSSLVGLKKNFENRIHSIDCHRLLNPPQVFDAFE